MNGGLFLPRVHSETFPPSQAEIPKVSQTRVVRVGLKTKIYTGGSGHLCVLEHKGITNIESKINTWYDHKDVNLWLSTPSRQPMVVYLFSNRQLVVVYY